MWQNWGILLKGLININVNNFLTCQVLQGLKDSQSLSVHFVSWNSFISLFPLTLYFHTAPFLKSYRSLQSRSDLLFILSNVKYGYCIRAKVASLEFTYFIRSQLKNHAHLDLFSLCCQFKFTNSCRHLSKVVVLYTFIHLDQLSYKLSLQSFAV